MKAESGRRVTNAAVAVVAAVDTARKVAGLVRRMAGDLVLAVVAPVRRPRPRQRPRGSGL